MDEAQFDLVVEIAGHIYSTTKELVADPAGWVDWYNRALEKDGQTTQLRALIEDAQHPERRSTFAADAANLIQRLHDEHPERVQPFRRRGPKPEGEVIRDFAVIAAVWFLSERLGVKPTRNEATDRLSPCDAVAQAVELKYKNTERIWNGRRELLRRNPTVVMALWAALADDAKNY